MSDEFDDVFGGEGLPSVEQTIKTRDYLKRHNRKHGVRDVAAELVARGFTCSKATAARHLKGVPGGQPARPAEKSPVAEAANRIKAARETRKSSGAKVSDRPNLTLEQIASLGQLTVPELAQILIEANSSTAIAIRENRTRMALNIMIAETMASRPELLLLDMRGTAALVDALTVASKLSGGASIDIQVPVKGVPLAPDQPDPAQMKDITPQRTQLADDLARFRAQRAAGSAQRT